MWPPGAAMGFELADDDDDFWADATTMGCASFARYPSEPARPRAGAALSSRNLGTLQIRTAVFPPTRDQPTRSRTRFDRAIEEMERQARDTSKSQGEPAAGSSYPLMPPTSGGSARIPTPPPVVGAGGSFRGGSAGADVEAILREKELELGTKDAHLRMLRSRLDMADRDAEEMRRKLDAANARLAAAGGNRDANLADSTNRNANHNQSSAYSGPAARDVSNAAALAEAKAEVARLRAQVAFREEEAEEARRREDDQRARLQRAEAETMKLAAEVRSERRRAEQRVTGTRKRAADDDDGGRHLGDVLDGDDANRHLGDANRRGGSKRRRGLGGEEEPTNHRGDGEEEPTAGRRGSWRSPPPPPVTLVLPPPPPHARIAASRASGGDGACFGLSSGLSSGLGGASMIFASISARFPEETCALLGEDVAPNALGLHPTGPGDVEGGAVLLETIRNVSRALRNLSADVGDARELASACAAACAAAADAPKAVVKSAAHLERARVTSSPREKTGAFGEELNLNHGSGVREQRVSHPGIAGVLSVLSAAVEADPCTAAHVLELCGAPLRAVPSAVAPSAPPPQLAGIPAASGAGALVPHPAALGSSPRVFAPAPTDTVADIALNAHSGGGLLANESSGGGGSPDDGARSGRDPLRPSPGPLLENVCAVLAASAATGGWATATAACEFLARCVASAPAMEGRGVFVACVSDGVLERCLAAPRSARGAGGFGASTSFSNGSRSRWNSAKTAAALAAARAHEGFTNGQTRARTPPPGLKLRALVVLRLLAATEAFTAFLDEDGESTAVSASAPKGSKSSTRAAAAAADVLDLTVEPASQTVAGAGAGTGGDGSRPMEEHEPSHEPSREPSPTLAAVVAAVNANPANDDCNDDAGCAVSDAALSVVHALSHGGWRGWGDAVRAHAILPAAVDACDAAFRRRAVSSAAKSGESDDDATDGFLKAERRVKGALMLVARLLAEPGSAARAIAGLRRDGETARVLARVAAAAGAHPEQMPRRVGRYFASLLPTVTPQVGE